MSLYWFGWGMARTLAPLIGGYLNDNISPRSIWIGGLLFGLTSAAGLFLLNSLTNPQTAPHPQPELDLNQ
jgi:MFS family permease